MNKYHCSSPTAEASYWKWKSALLHFVSVEPRSVMHHSFCLLLNVIDKHHGKFKPDEGCRARNFAYKYFTSSRVDEYIHRREAHRIDHLEKFDDERDTAD